MLLIIAVYIAGGCFIDSLALIMLTIRSFTRWSRTRLDPIWFGVIIVLVTQIGVITPRGINVYVVSGVARDVPLEVIFRGVVPMLIALIALTLILIPFPKIVLFLPSLLR